MVAFSTSHPELNKQQFLTCVSDWSAKAVVDRDVALARSLSIGSTPATYINTLRVEGAVDGEQMRTLIKQVRAAELAH